MDELERLYNELPYFDKQKFIGRHLADVRQEDIDEYLEDGMQRYSELDIYSNSDKQPIMESGGWHTEQPTENGWYLVDTPDFPKNCECVVAEWDNDAKHFYSESSDYPIEFRRWKLIERG